MARTTDSPRCCATSKTKFSFSPLIEGFVSVSALRMRGSLPAGNSTSTTGPMTWVILPLVPAVLAVVVMFRFVLAGLCGARSMRRRGGYWVDDPRGVYHDQTSLPTHSRIRSAQDRTGFLASPRHEPEATPQRQLG